MPDKVLSLKKEDFFCLAETILKQGNCIRFRAEGWSMSPSIRGGDIIKVSPVMDDITPGDIIFYRSEGNTAVVHRVVEKIKRDGRESILTKGDSSLGLDNPVIPDQILGKVVVIENNGFSIRPFLSKTLHWIQSIRLYRILARILLRPEGIRVMQATGNDLQKLDNFYSGGSGNFTEDLEGTPKENDPGLSWIAKKCDRIVGGVELSPLEERGDKNPVWIINSLHIHYKYRRLGLGEKLVRETIGYLNRIGADEVRLYVSSLNTSAIKLYKKLGFAVINKAPHNPVFKEFVYLRKYVKDASGYTS